MSTSLTRGPTGRRLQTALRLVLLTDRSAFMAVAQHLASPGLKRFLSLRLHEVLDPTALVS